MDGIGQIRRTSFVMNDVHHGAEFELHSQPDF